MVACGTNYVQVNSDHMQIRYEIAYEITLCYSYPSSLLNHDRIAIESSWYRARLVLIFFLTSMDVKVNLSYMQYHFILNNVRAIQVWWINIKPQISYAVNHLAWHKWLSVSKADVFMLHNCRWTSLRSLYSLLWKYSWYYTGIACNYCLLTWRHASTPWLSSDLVIWTI